MSLAREKCAIRVEKGQRISIAFLKAKCELVTDTGSKTPFPNNTRASSVIPRCQQHPRIFRDSIMPTGPRTSPISAHRTLPSASAQALSILRAASTTRAAEGT